MNHEGNSKTNAADTQSYESYRTLEVKTLTVNLDGRDIIFMHPNNQSLYTGNEKLSRIDGLWGHSTLRDTCVHHTGTSKTNTADTQSYESYRTLEVKTPTVNLDGRDNIFMHPSIAKAYTQGMKSLVA